MTDLADLIARVERSHDASNELDIAIDIALFTPDATYKSVRANAAGTKLVYTRHDGKTDTYWAHDHTLGLARRSATVALLRSLRAGAQN